MDDSKADLLRRLHCAEGHLRGVAAMIEREEDCENIVHQLLAVQGALREVNRRLLNHHLEVCLQQPGLEPDLVFRKRYLADIVALYHSIRTSAS